MGPKKLLKSEFYLVHFFAVSGLVLFWIYVFVEKASILYASVALFAASLFIAFYHLVKPEKFFQKKYLIFHLGTLGFTAALISYFIWREAYLMGFALIGLCGTVCEIFKHSIRRERI